MLGSRLLRRRNCRSLFTEATETFHDNICFVLDNENSAEQAANALKPLGSERGFQVIPDQLVPEKTVHKNKHHRRRQCYSESYCISKNTSNPSRILPCIQPLPARLTPKRFHSKLEGGTKTASHAPALPVEISHYGERPHEAKINNQAVNKTIDEFLNYIKPPAQTEWEQLWYHGVSAACQQLGHKFSQLNEADKVSSQEHNVAEPTLELSNLNKEERSLFEQEDSPVSSSLATLSELERSQRLYRAGKATDKRQRCALLLGLPTFHEYIGSKLQAQSRLQQDFCTSSRRQVKRETRLAQKKERKLHAKVSRGSGMTQSQQATSSVPLPLGGAEHRPLVVGLTKPQSTRYTSTMASSSEAAALNKEIEENIKENTSTSAPAEEASTASPAQKPKKEKGPKQPKAPKAAAPVAPTTPALIDLRVGHILRAIAHPNADSLYVSTIAMGDPEGTEHTQVDEETGKIVRTVCSGLNGLVPLEEMQNRKVVVVANLKPVNMRSIKSAAMVLAASPKQPEGADPHAADRVVELVNPPETAEAGEKVYFEGWPYGDGKGPEKQLNPKKKQWEAIQPGFYTSDELIVGFDAGQCEEVEGSEKGNLVVEGKGVCKVRTLSGAVVR